MNEPHRRNAAARGAVIAVLFSVLLFWIPLGLVLYFLLRPKP
jgi:membrane protein insertase Oxa1/YidC/SpoIIIJ